MPPKEQQHRGTKRKRDEGKRREKKPEDRQAKLSGKLHSGLVVLQRAAKKAKVFETQKIVKRLKKPDPKQKESSNDLEAQLKALKILDTDLIIRSAFVTRLRKDGVLSKDERLITALDALNIKPSAQAPAKENTEEGSKADDPNVKLEARIRSSKHVADAMKGCVESLRSLVLGKEGKEKDASKEEEEEAEEEEAATPVAIRKVRHVKEDLDASDSDSDSPTDDNVPTDFTPNRSIGADDEKESGDGFEDSGWESDVLNAEEGSIGGTGEDIDDDGWESGSIHSGDVQPKKKTKVKTKSKSDLPQKAPTQPAESMFLPTLANGYIAGGSSDDDWSDDESAGKGKKNRRGQRARRKIWEQKYGKFANHTKKAREAENAAKLARMKAKVQSRQPQPGRRFGQRGGGFKPEAQREDKGYASRSSVQQGATAAQHGGAAATTAGNAGKGGSGGKAEASLHPSWTAKKKAKEKEALKSVGQGTKTKFD